MAQNMSKMAGSKGSNAANRRYDSQNITEETVTITRLRSAETISMNVPGGGNVAEAVGGVREGSARKYANAMDSITGPADAPVREASDGNN